jgi:uncharacterized protein (TIGR02996 family)
MPPPGHEPFLRAICENPEDDTVRLVYADWLDENGDPDRAEFIRLQVAQADKPRMYDADYFRAEALFRKNRDAWFAELPEVLGFEREDTFRRGFSYAVRARTVTYLVRHHAQLFATAPIQSLTLYGTDERALVKTLQVPEIERLTELYLARCSVDRGRFKVLTDCPRLTRLRTLGIRGRTVYFEPALTFDEARAFVETPHFPALAEIYLDGTLSDRTAELLKTRYETVRFTGRHRE